MSTQAHRSGLPVAYMHWLAPERLPWRRLMNDWYAPRQCSTHDMTVFSDPHERRSMEVWQTETEYQLGWPCWISPRATP